MHSACIRDNSVGLGDEAPNNFYGEAGRVIMRRSVEPVYIGLIPMPLPKVLRAYSSDGVAPRLHRGGRGLKPL